MSHNSHHLESAGADGDETNGGYKFNKGDQVTGIDVAGVEVNGVVVGYDQNRKVIVDVGFGRRQICEEDEISIEG